MPRAAAQLDWSAAAALLAERRDTPAVLLDGEGRIRLFNSALEQLLGRPRVQVINRQWTEEFVPLGERDAVQFRLKEAVSGAVDRFECPVLDRSGERIVLVLDFATIGGAGAPSALASVVAVRRPRAGDHRGIVELHYDIAITEPEFGMVKRASSSDQDLGESMVGHRCYEVMHKRRSPCPGCPALKLDRASRSWAVIVSRWNDAPYAIIAAEPATDGTRRMAAFFVEAEVASALNHARLDQLAESAGLSTRELEVLKLIVLGRSSSDIALVLGISERTAKYHQSNILQKLGAESRLDLLRLFF